jgi:TldD protein
LAQTDTLVDTLGLARRAILAPGGLDEHGPRHRRRRPVFPAAPRRVLGARGRQVKEGSAASSRVSACGRRAARKPASPIPTRSCPARSKRRTAAARHRQASGGEPACRPGVPANAPALYLPLDPLETLSEDGQGRAGWKRVDAEARAMDPRVQVMVSLAAVRTRADRRQRWHTGRRRATAGALNVSVIVEQDGRREQGYSGGGGRVGYGWFLDQDRALGHAREAVRQALVNLEAVPAPAGTMTVVLGPGWPGVLLHEAIGHGLEGRFQPQGYLGLQRADRREGRHAVCARWWTTAPWPPARLA